MVGVFFISFDYNPKDNRVNVAMHKMNNKATNWWFLVHLKMY